MVKYANWFLILLIWKGSLEKAARVKLLYFKLNIFLTIIYADMEDAHTTLLSLKEDKDAAFFAVFDGHGGRCKK